MDIDAICENLKTQLEQIESDCNSVTDKFTDDMLSGDEINLGDIKTSIESKVKEEIENAKNKINEANSYAHDADTCG